MNSILLSIIIPVYNVERYLVRCLDSIYEQAVEETLFEVIAINDGSSDGSLDILYNYQMQHQNFIVHSKRNGGLSSARNKGLELAKGRYVWFIDSDDWVTTNSLDIVIKTIESDYDVISTILIYSYDEKCKNYSERTLAKDIDVKAADYLLNHSLGASQRYIIKRSYLEANNLEFYPNILHEDGDFGPRLVAPCGKVHLLAEPIYHYYQREEGSIMSSWGLKNSSDLVFVSNRIDDYLQTICDKNIKDALSYVSFSTLMFAFQPQRISGNSEIRELYLKNKSRIREKSLRVLLAARMQSKKRILAFACLISPRLYYKLKR